MPGKNSPEARVVYSLKQHLLADGLRGGRVAGVIVDADGAYQASPHAKALEPMATIWIDGFRPDLVCSVKHERMGIGRTHFAKRAQGGSIAPGS